MGILTAFTRLTTARAPPLPQRLAQLERWISALHPDDAWTIAPASADASFRRYFRVTFERPATRHGERTVIVMDAPPEKEDCRPFVSIARLFGDAGAHVPRVLAENLAEGFLLLTDLGTTTYLQALDERTADALYRDAISALVAIQTASRPGVLPPYDRVLLERELRLFAEWFVGRQLGLALSDAQQAVLERTFEVLLENNLAQPAVFVHRDYHSRNLMVATPNPGILDFQDAVFGPITYDLVSLLRDAYVAWPEARVLDWTIRYWEEARKAGLPVQPDFAEFYRDFEWMGVQRQIKVVGIFARLAHRDGKLQYLGDQPLVMRYLRAACERYVALAPFAKLLDELAGKATAVGYTF
jgi:aminoglycoside/choline kinase family phosphotransferase